jgi:hypothetical protein
LPFFASEIKDGYFFKPVFSEILKMGRAYRVLGRSRERSVQIIFSGDVFCCLMI